MELPRTVDVRASLMRAAAAARQALASGWGEDGAQRFNWLPVLIGVGIGIYFALPVEPPAFLAIAALVPLLAYFVVRWADCADALVASFAATAAKEATSASAQSAQRTTK